jgi:hypothetical protein
MLGYLGINFLMRSTLLDVATRFQAAAALFSLSNEPIIFTTGWQKQLERV